MFRKECFETINITRPRDLQGKLDHSCRLLGKELWHILCIYQLIKITPASRRTRAKLSYRQCRYQTCHNSLISNRDAICGLQKPQFIVIKSAERRDRTQDVRDIRRKTYANLILLKKCILRSPFIHIEQDQW